MLTDIRKWQSHSAALEARLLSERKTNESLARQLQVARGQASESQAAADGWRLAEEECSGLQSQLREAQKQIDILKGGVKCALAQFSAVVPCKNVLIAPLRVGLLSETARLSAFSGVHGSDSISSNRSVTSQHMRLCPAGTPVVHSSELLH